MIEAENREKLDKCPVCFSADIVLRYEKQDKALTTKDRFTKCSDCGAFFIANRLNSKFIIEKFYQKSRSEIKSTEFYLKKKRHLRKIVKALEKFLSPQAAVLDIGCGGGAFLKFLYDKGYQVHGLEVGEKAKKQAEKIIGQPNVVYTGEFLEMDFKENFFDAVSLIDVLEHLPSPHIYLEKILGILKPEGILIIRTPNSASYMHRFLQSKWQLASPRHIILYNQKPLFYLLKKNDFKIVYFKTNKGIAGNFFPPFSYGFPAFFRGLLINALRLIFSIAGKGESLTVFAKKAKTS